MKRTYIGNRVFTVKHGRAKLSHGPFSGHVSPLVKHLPSFDGSFYYRLVFVPHDTENFEHDMWVRRRNKVIDRLHRADMRDTLPIAPVTDLASSRETEVRANVLLSAVEGVDLFFREDGLLGAATCGSDDKEPVKRQQQTRSLAPKRCDWVRSARLMC
jgi:hypothetical protein